MIHFKEAITADLIYENVSIVLDLDDVDATIDSTVAKKFCDDFIKSREESNTMGQITFYIHNINNVPLLKELISYIRVRNNTSIQILVKSNREEIFSRELVGLFNLQNTKMIYITKWVPKEETLKNVDKIIFNIMEDNVEKLNDTYTKCNNIGLKHIEFDFNTLTEFSPEIEQIIREQFTQIIKTIKISMANNKMPLFPDNLIKMMFNVLLSENSSSYTARHFDYWTLCKTFNNELISCVTLWIDGRIYLGDIDLSLYQGYTPEIKKLCIKEFNFQSDSFINLCKIDSKILSLYNIKEDSENSDAENFDKLFEIEKISSFDCDKCPARIGCYAGNVTYNLLHDRLPNEADKLFCSYSKCLFDMTYKFMKVMDNSHNEMFREFMFICYSNNFDCAINSIYC